MEWIKSKSTNENRMQLTVIVIRVILILPLPLSCTPFTVSYPIHLIALCRIISHYIISQHILSHHIASHHSTLHLITPHHIKSHRITGDWNTACAHFKSMLATERFVVEIDDVAREQVIEAIQNKT